MCRSWRGRCPRRRDGDQGDLDENFADVKARLGSRPGVEIHRASSIEAVKKIDDKYFDWVYLDGNHYYEFVLGDLEHHFAKIKPGGRLIGDDLRWLASVR